MSNREILVSGCLLLVFVSVWTAPVKEQVEKRSAGQNLAQVEGEDQDLQELLNLVNKQTHQDDVMVHQEHVTHIENNDGQSVKIEEKEEKVVDTDSGKVLADLKQQKQTDFAPGKQTVPQTIVKTKVDIPAAGVHQTFLQTDNQARQDTGDKVAVEESNEDDDDDDDTVIDEDDDENNDEASEPDLTPSDMAAYLYETQQFSAFYSAMDRLVNESKMVPEDAEAYARAVAVEYERLQLQDLEERYMVERRSYPQQPLLDSQMYGPLPGYDLYPQPMGVAETSDPTFDMLTYINSLMSPEEQFLAQRQAQNEADLMTSDTVDPYQFVAALWNEAYERGNEEAQEIVRLLYDRVSHDSNPDDMGEIRDLLLDTVAQSLGEGTPYAFETPIDTPLAMPQMPESQEEAGLVSPEGVASDSEEAKTEMKDDEEEEEKQEEDEGQETNSSDLVNEQNSDEEKENKEENEQEKEEESTGEVEEKH